jgi:hypothetical protein
MVLRDFIIVPFRSLSEHLRDYAKAAEEKNSLTRQFMVSLPQTIWRGKKNGSQSKAVGLLLSKFDEAEGVTGPEDAFAAAPEFGFPFLLPGHDDFAAETLRDERSLAHLIPMTILIPFGVVVFLEVVEAVLATPLYVIERHNSGLRCAWERVKDEGGKKGRTMRRKRPTALPYFHGLC